MILGVDVRAVLQQNSYGRNISSLRRSMQRRLSVMILGVDVRAVLQQTLHDRNISTVSRPV